MEVLLIVVSGFIATSLMTLFSYLISNIKGRQFREPELLNILISRSTLFPWKIKKDSWVGWAIHYSIGWFFVICFYLIWKYTKMEPSVATGALFGFLAGIIGISGWKIFFLLHHDPPEIDFKNFYIQLIVAHIIFGLGAVLVFL